LDETEPTSLEDRPKSMYPVDKVDKAMKMSSGQESGREREGETAGFEYSVGGR